MVQTPIIYDVKTTPKVLRTQTGSKDLQTVNLTLRVLFRLVFALIVIESFVTIDECERRE